MAAFLFRSLRMCLGYTLKTTRTIKNRNRFFEVTLKRYRYAFLQRIDFKSVLPKNRPQFGFSEKPFGSSEEPTSNRFFIVSYDSCQEPTMNPFFQISTGLFDLWWSILRNMKIRFFEVLFSDILIFGINYLNYIVSLLKESGIGYLQTIEFDSMNNRESVLSKQLDSILWIIGNRFFANNRTWFYE